MKSRPSPPPVNYKVARNHDDALTWAQQGIRCALIPGIEVSRTGGEWTQLGSDSCDGPCPQNGTRVS